MAECGDTSSSGSHDSGSEPRSMSPPVAPPQQPPPPTLPQWWDTPAILLQGPVIATDLPQESSPQEEAEEEAEAGSHPQTAADLWVGDFPLPDQDDEDEQATPASVLTLQQQTSPPNTRE